MIRLVIPYESRKFRPNLGNNYAIFLLLLKRKTYKVVATIVCSGNLMISLNASGILNLNIYAFRPIAPMHSKYVGCTGQ